jgi:site-specific recombinase XerD
MTVNEAIEKYKKYLMVTRSKGTVDYYKGKVGILSQYLGYMRCEDINEDTLLDFIIKQRERNVDITNRTLNKYIGTLRQTLSYSCKIEVNFDKLPEIKKIITTIPLDTTNMIFNYYRRNQSNLILQRNYILFRLLHETGLRLNELLNLKVNDFNFERNTIHVKRTKTNLERYVFYTRETEDLIIQYLHNAKLDYYLFIDFITGDILKGHSVETICKRLRKTLGIKISINPHKWRHTFASNFVKQNGNMEVLRQIMGHTSLKTTQKYLHINVDDLHKEYFRLYN